MNNNLISFITFILILTFAVNIKAQDSLAVQNSAYVELGGNSVVFSMNYEREIIYNVGVKAGIGFCVLPISTSSKSGDNEWSFFPLYNIMAQYFLRISHNSSFGLNLGLGFIGSPRESDAFLYTSKIGIRYSPYDGGFLLDLSYTPIWDSDNRIMSWFGIGIGTSF